MRGTQEPSTQPPDPCIVCTPFTYTRNQNGVVPQTQARHVRGLRPQTRRCPPAPKPRDGCDQTQVQSKQARCTDGEQRPLTRTQGRLAFPVCCREVHRPAWAPSLREQGGTEGKDSSCLTPKPPAQAQTPRGGAILSPAPPTVSPVGPGPPQVMLAEMPPGGGDEQGPGPDPRGGFRTPCLTALAGCGMPFTMTGSSAS